MREFSAYACIYRGILRNRLKRRHVASRYEMPRPRICASRVSLATDQFYNHHTATCAAAHAFLFPSLPSQTHTCSTPKGQHGVLGTTDLDRERRSARIPRPCRLPPAPVSSEPLPSPEAPPVNSNCRRGRSASSKERLYFYFCCRRWLLTLL